MIFSPLSLFFFVGRLYGIFVIEKFKHILLRKWVFWFMFYIILFFKCNISGYCFRFRYFKVLTIYIFSFYPKKKKASTFSVPFKSIIAFWYTNPSWLSWCVILLRPAGVTQVLHWLAVALKKRGRSAGQGGSQLDCIGGIQSVRFPIFLPYWCLSID